MQKYEITGVTPKVEKVSLNKTKFVTESITTCGGNGITVNGFRSKSSRPDTPSQMLLNKASLNSSQIGRHLKLNQDINVLKSSLMPLHESEIEKKAFDIMLHSKITNSSPHEIVAPNHILVKSINPDELLQHTEPHLQEEAHRAFVNVVLKHRVHLDSRGQSTRLPKNPT